MSKAKGHSGCSHVWSHDKCYKWPEYFLNQVNGPTPRRGPKSPFKPRGMGVRELMKNSYKIQMLLQTHVPCATDSYTLGEVYSCQVSWGPNFFWREDSVERRKGLSESLIRFAIQQRLTLGRTFH